MFWRQVAVLVRRDLAVEAATREALATVPPLILAGLLLAGIGLDLPPAALAAAAPGLLWLLVLSAAVPLARSVLAAERDDDAWDLLRSLARPSALLAAKATTLGLQLMLAWAIGAALAVALLGARWPGVAVLAAAIAMPGIAANVTIFGAVLGEHGRPALLTVLVLAVGLPAYVAGTQVAVGEAAAPWLVLLLVYDVVAVVVGWAIFPTLLEE